MDFLKYVGGPQHGQQLVREPGKDWPPRQIVIYADRKAMAPSKPVGRYCLRGATLEWRPAKTCN